MKPSELARMLVLELAQALAPGSTSTHEPLASVCLAELESPNFFGPLFSLYAMSRVEDYQRILRRLSPRPSRVVDLGSGIGRYAIPLARDGLEVDSVEICAFARMLQQEIARAEGLPVSCYTSLRELGVRRDAVLCLFSTITDPRMGGLGLFFGQVGSILRQGGLLLVDSIPLARRRASFPAQDEDEWLLGSVKKKAWHRTKHTTELEWRWETPAGAFTYLTTLCFPEEDHLLVIAQDCGFSLTSRHDLDEENGFRRGIEWEFAYGG